MPQRERMWYEGQPVTIISTRRLPKKMATIRLSSGFVFEVPFRKLKPMQERDVLASFEYDQT
jgi:hypothetical protein